MLAANSRYKNTPGFTGEGGSSFRGLRPRSIPTIPGVIEHTLTADERLDQLAFHYYNDDRLGWRILDANPQSLHGGELLPVKDELAATAVDPSPNPTDPRKRAGDILLIPHGRTT